jgi:hypothetical protein
MLSKLTSRDKLNDSDAGLYHRSGKATIAIHQATNIAARLEHEEPPRHAAQPARIAALSLVWVCGLVFYGTQVPLCTPQVLALRF